MKEAAQLVLLNDDGEVLAVSRKDDHYDFGLVGGKRDPEDASIEDAAIRECLEETGLEAYNLRPIFLIHKYGYLNYTFLADWRGEINTDEEHIVKWTHFSTVMNGTFGKYNKLVAQSLFDMGIRFKVHNGNCTVCNNTGMITHIDENDPRPCHHWKHWSIEKIIGLEK